MIQVSQNIDLLDKLELFFLTHRPKIQFLPHHDLSIALSPDLRDLSK
jgi:hypothetical protein